MNKEGEILSSSLAKASGVRMLDNATVQLIAKANPLPKPPAHILSQRLSIEVPIRYFIR
ncbi:energy transducer TonB [Colwellia sp. D2M02]|uniref:energy transducer TonB family protein n=1 Tax=Colwellia sp. D2M02 TaxID=2841562 RepID=UPI001C08547F|nr:energy transducer TonB [Colwellia sp. D2M02]